MEFTFSDEEKDLRRAVSDFVQKEITEKDLNRPECIPKDVMEKMGDLGLFALRIPETFGGKPGSWVDIGILVEEIARGNASLAFLTMLFYEVSLLLAGCGTPQIAEEWMPRLAKGAKLGSIALTELESGSDTSIITTLAIRDGNYYVINGEKCPVSFGMQADFTILFAKTLGETGAGGITAFLVPLELPGIKRTPFPNTGLLSSTPASLVFDNVRIPAYYRIGREGEGLEINQKHGLFSDLNQILAALVSVGVCQTALRLAVLYARERVAFGRPIAQFQAISGKIAEDSTLLEAGRWLCYRGLYLKDRGLPNTKEAAMSGWWCPKVAFEIVEDSLLIHGHSGYSDDHPFQQMLRDVLAFQMIAGRGQVLKLSIARDVIGEVAVPGELAGVI
ncbi:MAG: acyl-CoA dehydrogenase family protein [Proteobacteria bacterium]|nr:acyl-CoA dehydrogenase family protein [Pseudomonadota bacterium]